MTFKGQEEDNRQQLSKITKGAIFRVLCHCLLHGGLAFLIGGWCLLVVGAVPQHECLLSWHLLLSWRVWSGPCKDYVAVAGSQHFYGESEAREALKAKEITLSYT